MSFNPPRCQKLDSFRSRVSLTPYKFQGPFRETPPGAQGGPWSTPCSALAETHTFSSSPQPCYTLFAVASPHLATWPLFILRIFAIHTLPSDEWENFLIPSEEQGPPVRSTYLTNPKQTLHYVPIPQNKVRCRGFPGDFQPPKLCGPQQIPVLGYLNQSEASTFPTPKIQPYLSPQLGDLWA